MRHKAVLHLAAVTVVLIIWGIAINSFDIQKKLRHSLGLNYNHIKLKSQAATTPAPKCSLPRHCPPDSFAVHISSGAANIVGPKICFDGKIILSHVLNNVRPGLNIVVVDGENRTVEKIGFLNMKDKNILTYLKEIKSGMIVLVASFDDVTSKMTDEMREVFVGMGSTLIKSVKRRDNWVFVGRVGTGVKSRFENRAVNDEKTNIFEGWPEVVEVGGCFPRTLTDEHKPESTSVMKTTK